ncbi:MAG: hypothetical protein AAB297_08195 [Acidobacteriota bacterium]
MTRGRLTTLTLTVAAVIAVAAFGLPRAKHWGEARLRRALEERATALLGGPVRIGRLSIELVPPGVHLETIEAERRGNRGSEATAAAGRVTVRASTLTFLRAARGPVTVRVERPRFKMVLAAGRPLDFIALLGAGHGPGGPGGATVAGPGGAAAALAAVPAG